MSATAQWWFITTLLLGAAVLGFWSPALAIVLIAVAVLVVGSVALDLRRLLLAAADRSAHHEEVIHGGSED